MIPVVSMLTPTINRPETHPALYENFSSDRWPNKELVVLDESREPSPFFASLRDGRVRYFHTPRVPVGDGVTRIGAVRNRLNQLALGDIFFHRDDDDWYSPEAYTHAMVDRLGDAALAKMDVYRLHHIASGTVFEWDTRVQGGHHYALMGSVVDRVEVPHGGEPMLLDALRLGFGFSYAYPRRTWEHRPFPSEGTEDYPWARAIRDGGGKIVFVSDRPDLVLHSVHPKSASGCYPQKYIGTTTRRMIGAGPSLQASVRASMIGKMSTELPRGEPISVVPGVDYTVLVSLKDNHSLKDLTVRAASWGVTVTSVRDHVPPSEFGVEGPPSGYRLVLVQARSSKPGKLPWAVPAPLSIFDRTSVVRAWNSAPPPMVGTLRSMP